jgi:hypothetical protein
MTMSKEDRKMVFAVTPNRICTGVYHANNRSCALGWADNFKMSRNKFESKYRKVYRVSTNQKFLDSCVDVVKINDGLLQNDMDRAALINATLREMGYRIPKSSTVGKNILQKGWTVKKG